MELIEELKQLCSLDGGSGCENAVREYITSRLDEMKIEYRIDALGNVIGKKSGKTTDYSILITAHMDEISLIITSVSDDGTLCFATVGGIAPEAIAGKKVRLGEIYGVVGMRSVHNMTEDEKAAPPKLDDMYIDIGAADADEARSIVKCGSYAYFVSDFIRFGNDKLLSKALDDRIGCAVLLGLLSEQSEIGFDFAFTVQEEVGARGARTAAFSVAPDYAVVLEATTAADIPSVSGEKRVCELGKGAAVAFMDNATVYDKWLYNLAYAVSAEHSIPCQTKSMVAGGNDSGSIHVTGKGVKCIAVSAPCRYIHSPSCVAAESDIFAVKDLTRGIVSALVNKSI